MKLIFSLTLIFSLGLLSIAGAATTTTKSNANTSAPVTAPATTHTTFDTIVDVRTADEFGADHVQGAMNIDVLDAKFEEKLKALDKSKSYAVYCRSGARSEKAKTLMTKLGFTKVVNLGSLAQAKEIVDKTKK